MAFKSRLKCPFFKTYFLHFICNIFCILRATLQQYKAALLDLNEKEQAYQEVKDKFDVLNTAYQNAKADYDQAVIQETNAKNDFKKAFRRR